MKNFKREYFIFPGLLFLYSVAILWPSLFSNKIYFADDQRIAGLFGIKESLPMLFWSSWDNSTFLGAGRQFPIKLELLLLSIFSPKWTLILIVLIVPSITFFSIRHYFLAQGVKGLQNSLISFFGSLIPMWYSIFKGGHPGKMLLIPGFFFAFTGVLYFLKNRPRIRSKSYWVLVIFISSSLTITYLAGEIQVGLYLSVLLMFYLIYKLVLIFIKDYTKGSFSVIKKNLNLLFALVLIPFFSILLSAQVIKEYIEFTGLVTDRSIEIPVLEELKEDTDNKENKQNWDWATQWSMPISETVELFIPGVFGYYTGHPDVPYWGKVGQTPGWESHKQGYRNYSYYSNYLGLFVFIFLIYAFLSKGIKDKYFWISFWVIALFLNYGRFFPLYQFFYELPLMDKFRNPNKFIHVVNFITIILSGLGVSAFYQDIKENKKAVLSLFFKILAIFSLGIFISLIISMGLQGVLERKFSPLFGIKETVKIIENLYYYLFKGFALLSLTTLLLFFWMRMKKNLFLYLLLGLFIVDVYIVSKNYFQFVPSNKPEDNISKMIKKDQLSEASRIKFYQKRNYLNYFEWNLLPVNSIESMDVTVMRQWNPVWKGFLTKLNSQSLISYRLGNVKHFLSQQPVSHPMLKPTHQSKLGNNEGVFIYELTTRTPRIYPVSKPILAQDAEHLFTILNDPNFLPEKNGVLLEEHFEISQGAQKLDLINDSDITDFSFVKINNNEYDIQYNFNSSTLVVLANIYNKDWILELENGEKISPIPSQYLLNGYIVPSGSGNAKISYAKDDRGLVYITLIAYLIFFSSLIYVIFYFRKENRKN